MTPDKTEVSSYLSDKTGMAPGSLIHIGSVYENESRISVTDFNKKTLVSHNVESIDDILQYQNKESITWVNVEGLVNIEFIQTIGDAFKIHPLVLEDILNTHQRPKHEDFENYQYIVLKGISVENEDNSAVIYEQISILLLKNFVITFKEKRDELFSPIVKRIESSSSRIRSFGSDYLTYAILDCIVDQNFSLLEALDERIDTIEEQLLLDHSLNTVKSIQQIKHELIYIRRAITPLRDLLGDILRSESPLITCKNACLL